MYVINGIKYFEVDRKANVGEYVVIVKTDPCLVYKTVGEIVKIIETNGDTCGILKPYDIGEKGAVYHFQYRTLEPANQTVGYKEDNLNAKRFRIKEAYMLFSDKNGETVNWKLKPCNFTDLEQTSCEFREGTGVLSIDDSNIHMTLTPCDCTKNDNLEVDLNNFDEY